VLTAWRRGPGEGRANSRSGKGKAFASARFAVPVLEMPLLDGEVVGLERLGELLERTIAPTSLVA
jgi:hypothetical protein